MSQKDNPHQQLGLELIEFGWEVIPVLQSQKHPKFTGWPNMLAGNADWFCTLWEKTERQYPNEIVMTAAHVPRGVVVVDIDIHEADGFQTLIDERLVIPLSAWEGMFCSTYGGGRHVYFRDPQRKAETATGPNQLFPGIDIKASGIVVAYPGLSVLRPEDLEPAPDWCYPSLPRNPVRRPYSASEGIPVGTGEIIPEGKRNVTLYYVYAEPLARTGATVEEVLTLLREVNAALCRPPEEDNVLRYMAESACSQRRKLRYDPLLLDELSDAVASIRWGTQSDRLVYLAFLGLARGIKVTHHLGTDTRTLAKIADVSQKTADRSVRRLMEMGLIERVRKGRPGRRSVFNILPMIRADDLFDEAFYAEHPPL